jgi:hypothetical protein
MQFHAFLTSAVEEFAVIFASWMPEENHCYELERKLDGNNGWSHFFQPGFIIKAQINGLYLRLKK